MEELLELLSGVKPDIDFSAEKSLIDDGLLDSFDIVQIINELKETFDIEISPAEIIPENFNSAEALWNMVTRLQ